MQRFQRAPIGRDAIKEFRAGDANPIEKPLVVDNADALQWDEAADVVIVGFGSAGASAALTAQERGADVLVLDRFGGGGATRWSGGIIYGGNTRFQKESGIEDGPDNIYDYLSQEKMAVQPQTLRRFCEESGPQIEWLADHGVKYDGTVFPEPVTFPPEGFFLYYSGNEKHPGYADKARPAPRGHRPVGQGAGGSYYFAALRKAVESKPIRLMTHSPVRRLVTDRSGGVVGVEILHIPEDHRDAHAEIDGRIVPLSPTTAGKADKAGEDLRNFEAQFSERRLIRARAGVILAAGGFVYNPEKLGRHAPILGAARRNLMRLGTLGDDGSGIDLGLSVGGETGYMDSFFVGRSLAPPAVLLRGLMVNARGQRFASEDMFAPFLGMEMTRQPGGEAWLILDRETYRQARKEALFPGKGMRLFTLPVLLTMFLGGKKKAGSIAKLAQKIGVPAQTLEQTLAQANEQWGRGVDDKGKIAANIAPFGKGPFYALKAGIGYKFAPTMVFSMGGLKVDEETGAVIHPDATPIAGLYAAGRTAVGLISAADVNGLSIADTVFSGRRAGASASRNVNPQAA